MYEFDIPLIRTALVRAVALAVAAKKLVAKESDCFEHLSTLEREFREAAGEAQRVEKLMMEDLKRPLLGG